MFARYLLPSNFSSLLPDDDGITSLVMANASSSLQSSEFFQTLLPAIYCDDLYASFDGLLEFCGDYCCLCCCATAWVLLGILFFVVLDAECLFGTVELGLAGFPTILSVNYNTTLNDYCSCAGCSACASFGSSFHLDGIPFFVVLNTKLLLQAFKFLQASLPAICFFDHYVAFNDLLGATIDDCGGCGSAAGALV